MMNGEPDERVRLLLAKPGLAGVSKLYTALTGLEMTKDEMQKLADAFKEAPE